MSAHFKENPMPQIIWFITRSTMTTLLVLILLLAAAPVVAQPAQNAASDPGLSRDEGFAAIDAYVDAQMRELRIPGLALGIVEGDQIVHLKGFGIAGSDGRLVTPQTPFQIASIGKPMTGVAIMQLVEAGKLDLDAPVQRYLPYFRVADEAASAQITSRHLLYHTSGLPAAAGMEHAFSGDVRPDALEQHVRALRSVQLNRPVGASYEYSNAGYSTLGLLIQEVSGQSYEAYMHAHLYRPLEMRQTFTDWTEARSHGATNGHRYWFGAPVAGELPVNRANLPAGAHTSASAEDVAHFLIAQLNGGRFGATAILSPAGIAEMQRPVISIPNGQETFGMDWGIGPIGDVTTISKGGDNVDFKTQMILIPERRLGLVVLMNVNKGLDSSLGDVRLPMLSYNLAELLLGQPATLFPAGRTPTLLYAVLFLAIIVQLAGMARTALLLHRWKRRPEQRPQGRRAVALRLWLPLVLNLGWGLFALLGVPALFGMPLSFIGYLAPDFGATLLASGAIALGWGIARTALLWWVLRTAQRAVPVMIGTPAKA
jgi:CubicO group peptidase (beta-lactamase class C family)